MYCNKCGAEVEESSKFCVKCGGKVEIEQNANVNQTGSITFERKSQYYGVLVKTKIYLDGNQVATVGAGQQVTVPVAPGKHHVMFNVWSGNGANEIIIPEEHPNVKVVFKIGMGAITSKPKIVSISSI